MQLTLLTRFLAEVETCLKSGNVTGNEEVNKANEEVNKVNEEVKNETAFNKVELNSETTCKSGRKKVKKKVLVKKSKGEKNLEKNYILGEAFYYCILCW